MIVRTANPVALCVLVTLAALAAGGATAQTACPTAQDLARGIRIDFSDGSFEVYRAAVGTSAAEGATMMVDGYEANAVNYRLHLAQGTHLLRYETIANGQPVPESVQTYDYGLPASEMPVPQPGGRWQTAVTVTDDTGERSEAQAQAYDASGSVTIGTCTYDMVPVLIAYDTSDSYMETINYLPDLGIGYLVSNQMGGGQATTVSAVGISVGK